MKINPGNFVIYIVTYNRPEALNNSIRGYLASLPFIPKMFVISNHSVCKIDADLKKYVQVIYNNMRPDESWGYLTRSWNQCFQYGFREYEWVLCSQDDVIVKSGWLELVNSSDYDFYLAPLGDTRFLLNRKAFRNVGWFDERFVGIGWHEHDYIFRVLSLIPESSSIIDNHRHQIIKHNDVGLSDFWIQPDLDITMKMQERGGREVQQDGHVFRIKHFKEKWGVLPCQKFLGFPVSKLPEEIDWYPYIGNASNCLKIINTQFSLSGKRLRDAQKDCEITLKANKYPFYILPKNKIASSFILILIAYYRYKIVEKLLNKILKCKV